MSIYLGAMQIQTPRGRARFTLGAADGDPRPELPRDRVTFFTGEFDGARYGIPDTTSAYVHTVPISAGTYHSFYVPPGLRAIVFDGPDQKRASTTGDYYDRRIVDGPAMATRSTFRLSYGPMYWRWVRVQDMRSEAERERDAQAQAMARELGISEAEAENAQRLAEAAKRTADELELARQEQMRREEERAGYVLTQQTAAAQQAAELEAARQMEILKAQQQGQTAQLEQQRAFEAQQQGGMMRYALPAAGVIAAILIGGALLKRRA